MDRMGWDVASRMHGVMDTVSRSAAPLRSRAIQLQLPEPVGILNVEEDVHSAGPGGCVWDAAVALAQYVATEFSHADGLRGKRVLELGAGTGVPGLAAARLGADVVLTDRARALELLRRNVAANGVTDRVTVCELEWGAPRVPEALENTQLVLAADVVAHEEAFRPLLTTLQLLCRQGAHVLIANKCRDECEYVFWNSALELFSIEQLRCGVSDLNRDGDELPITIYRLELRDDSVTGANCTVQHS